ncbi:MAG: putative lipase [Symbiobacteriaceae bacterium]|jgi:pimeloyl-ACP methyl ester carboxylesterase|nr:putative lipase [Symbiobacteriaceae bacterium]
MRKRTLIFFAICLMLLLSLQPRASAGVLLGPGGAVAGGSPGTWYIGATPAGFDPAKPVLVFVHGKGGWSGSWWEPTVYHGTNDMYTYAYNNGYRTAFVDLYPERNMWTNGELLNRQLNEITAYFGVPKVTLVAHSKGGVDANAAAAHYGASGKISRVITLGSPHGGSPLADMAYSTWTWWLGELLGQRNEATYVLQTGYMSYFRSVTDGRGAGVPYYSLSGYRCGPFATALWLGCVFIGGEDDGLVPVWSARMPGATHLKEGYWDHDEIRMGSRVWSWFAPVIGPGSAGGPGPVAGALGSGGRPEAPGNLILRGGNTLLDGTAAFPVESGVRSATFTFLASSPSFSATLAAPDGSAYRVVMTGQVPAGDVFAGAWMGTVTVNSPAAGTWTLTGAAEAETGYVMVAALDSDLRATADVGQAVATPGGQQSLRVSFRGMAPAASRAEAAIAVAGQGAHGRPTFAADGRALFSLPGGNGIHNVTVTVNGTLPDGTEFERTLVTSFAAVDLGDRGTWR